MLRRSLVIAALVFTVIGNSEAQVVGNNAFQVITNGVWPAAGTVTRDSLTTVSARGSGQAQGASTFHITLSLSRSAAEREMAEGMLEAAIAAVKPSDGVIVVSSRKDPVRGASLMCPPQLVSAPAGSPAPSPAPATMTQLFTATATIEADAASRDAFNRWTARLPAQAGPCPGARANPPYPLISERVADADPAWDEAARSAIGQAERDARAAAKIAGKDLGPLLNLWTERTTSVVSNGKVTVQATAQYEMVAPHR